MLSSATVSMAAATPGGTLKRAAGLARSRQLSPWLEFVWYEHLISRVAVCCKRASPSECPPGLEISRHRLEARVAAILVASPASDLPLQGKGRPSDVSPSPERAWS